MSNDQPERRGGWDGSRRVTAPLDLDDVRARLTAAMDKLHDVAQRGADIPASPAAVLARVAADRIILTEVLSWGHDYNDADPYHSCAQASSTWEDDRSPGSGCADDDRAGQPCDCGVDTRRNVIIGALLDAYNAGGHR